MPDLASRALSLLATLWPNPMRRRNEAFGVTPGSDDYRRAYAKNQFMRRASRGLGVDLDLPELWGRDVLEIGCGPGGITCFMAGLGARRVVGIDLNEDHLRCARDLAKEIEARTGRALPLEYLAMDAAELAFAPGSFDLVLADNLFEHVAEPVRVLAEIFRVLRPGGLLLVPTFSAIKSKYGLHLKQGLKVPWANLLFSERTIVEALSLQAKRRPELFELYPGLAGSPETVRDVRKHRDLNGIGHAEFLEMAARTGFEIELFRPLGTYAGRVLFRLAPSLGRTRLGDVLSTGATAVLSKPGNEPR